MGSFIVSLIVGAAAGAVTARTLIRRELARQQQPVGQVANLRADNGSAQIQPAPAVPAPAPAPAGPEEITPEILMVLTAAVSAFLGKKAKIRRARVAQYAGLSSAWAQQGRVFVQASHNLPSPHHTR
jgi:methylmalonyl-CoA carboxyltransferase 12S subunit